MFRRNAKAKTVTPQVTVANAQTKYAELQGTVKVGAESAARLTELLGRPVAVGEEFDLGTLAAYSQDASENERLQQKVHQDRKRTGHLFGGDN